MAILKAPATAGAFFIGQTLALTAGHRRYPDHLRIVCWSVKPLFPACQKGFKRNELRFTPCERTLQMRGERVISRVGFLSPRFLAPSRVCPVDQVSAYSSSGRAQQPATSPDDTARAVSSPSVQPPQGDNDLREALRAMVTVVGIEAERGDGGKPRLEAAAAIGSLLGIDLVATAMRMPSAIGRSIPSDPHVLQRLITLLQQPNAGVVSRLAQAIDAVTLTLRPGFTQRVPQSNWVARSDQVPGRDQSRPFDDRVAPGRDDRQRA